MNLDMNTLLSHRRMSMYTYNVLKTVTFGLAPQAISKLAEQYKALGDETRLKLMLAVAAGENAEACVCDLTPDTGLAQSTVSHHLKLLVYAGLLDRSQRGKWAFYSLTGVAKKLLI
jgi:ArsR family transcriptional regulator